MQKCNFPEGVTMIAKSAFEGCNLTEIEIPEGVTDIGDEAFSGCYELRSIKIPDSVKAIGYAAFLPLRTSSINSNS